MDRTDAAKRRTARLEQAKRKANADRIAHELESGRSAMDIDLR